MMKYLLPLLTLLCLSCSTFAAEQLPILIVSDSGYSWMIQGEDGTPIVYKFSQVVVIGKPTQPIPPTTNSEFGISTQVANWLATASDKSDLIAIKNALTEVVTMASTPGKLKTLGEVEVVTGALLATSIKNKAAWAEFGKNLNQTLILLQANKKIQTPADYGRAINEVIKALP